MLREVLITWKSTAQDALRKAGERENFYWILAFIYLFIFKVPEIIDKEVDDVISHNLFDITGNLSVPFDEYFLWWINEKKKKV